MNIDHEYTDAPVCPHCGVAHEDAFEWGGGRADEGTRNCWKCKKPFKWERDISVTYSTEIAE
jgi:hypothetical protein